MIRAALRKAEHTKTVPWTVKPGGAINIGDSCVIEIDSEAPVKVRVIAGKRTGVEFLEPEEPSVLSMPVPAAEPTRRPAA